MSKPYDVAVIVGSPRRGSYNRMLAAELMRLAPSSLSCRFVEIAHLPMYDPDLEGEGMPENWSAFRDEVRRADAVLFVTPEYNRSVPGVLKNAIDVGSRPYGQSCWGGKPAAIVSGSLGAIGGFGANHHLRQCMVFLDMYLMQQPEAYLSGIDKMFGENGRITSEQTAAFVEGIPRAFASWTERLLGPKP
jgi:chromate reductase